MEALLVVIAVAGMFLLLIAPHEAGHFALAKLFKVRVIEFSIGAGTKLWSTTRGGTLYAIRAIPVIGYVRMGGMEAGDFEDPSGFHHKTAWQRILILAAGPAANFVVAILLFTGLGLTQLNDDVGKVARVVPNSPAAAAGFQAGDRLRTVEGQPITAPDQLRKVENAAPNAAIVVTGVHANGQPFAYIVTPQCDPKTNQCQVGLSVMGVVTVKDAVTNGLAFPFVAVSNIVQGLSQLVTDRFRAGCSGRTVSPGPSASPTWPPNRSPWVLARTSSSSPCFRSRSASPTCCRSWRSMAAGWRSSSSRCFAAGPSTAPASSTFSASAWPRCSGSPP